jgi:hypothetical protein
MRKGMLLVPSSSYLPKLKGLDDFSPELIIQMNC